ncbi:hypothetical protein THAOC_00188 [Thalassiosira oceanica]|uniref:Uncharacterized protein n=1 Tax=Thalassiosira oceanica TaxID=159749 RepID=K3W4H4_THAOC|nr:hypothetical protein THAOC_00188 [Thalassiosira oceanica]|eukprot:EJK77944.1 hypothetical protein THAOC_00188 [Thalassiosira oceanica]
MCDTRARPATQHDRRSLDRQFDSSTAQLAIAEGMKKDTAALHRAGTSNASYELTKSDRAMAGGREDYLAFWKRVPSPQSPPPMQPPTTRQAASPAGTRGPRLKDLSNSSPHGNGKNDSKQGSRDGGPLDSSLDANKQQTSNSCKKRRASISIPRGLGNGAARILASDEPERNNLPQPPSPKQILALVRAYCDLPEVDRQRSEQAQLIQDMTGYAMAQAQTLRPVNSDFLVNIQPTVREMEKQKKIDVEETRNATNCEVRKDKRGLYEYFDDCGDRVCPEEYSRRYNAMLATKKRRRLASQATAISQVQGDITQQTSSTSTPESKRVDDSMDMSTSMDESTIDEDVTPSRKDDPCEESGKGVQVVPGGDDIDGRGGIVGEKGTTHPLLGGLPPSTDPRIIMARKKLFQKFDEALSEYSTEVLKIERPRGKDSSSL